MHLNNLFLLLLLRICNHNLKHKTVYLRLRKRIGTLLLHRVLGSHNKEWRRKAISLVTNCNLPLLHSLQKCRLHLCRRSVNLVRKNKVCKDRALFNLELLALLAINHCSYHICRKKVRSKLDSVELCIYNVGESIYGQCLGKTRHTLQQYVTICKESYQQILHKMFLPHYHLVHLHCDNVYKSTLFLNSLIELFYIYTFHINIIYCLTLPLLQ